MVAFSCQDFIDAGLPKAIAGEVALQIAGQWVTDDCLPSVNRLIEAGCIPAVAEDIAQGIAFGFVHAGELSTLTGWTRSVGERINDVLAQVIADRNARISSRGRAA
jgi:hypothetical protein